MMCGLRNRTFFIIWTFSFLNFCSGEDILERMAAIEEKVEKLQEQNIQKDRRIGKLDSINRELVTEVQALRVSLTYLTLFGTGGDTFILLSFLDKILLAVL